MLDTNDQFVRKLESEIKSKSVTQARYKYARITLMAIIAVCGFFTAAASQSVGKASWLSSPTFLLLIGLLSSVCAVLNQAVNPDEKHSYHRTGKKALQIIKEHVEFGIMPINEAVKLKGLALTEPDKAIDQLLDKIGPKSQPSTPSAGSLPTKAQGSPSGLPS